MRLFLLLSLFAFAFAVDTSGLSPGDQEKVEALAKELKNKPTAVVIREEATAWAQLGTNVGQAMVSAAKELGVAAVDFSKTPLGQIVVFIIVMKVIGGQILTVIAGISIIFISLWIARVILYQYAQTPVYEYKPFLWGALQRKVVVKYEQNTEYSGYRVLSAVVAILGVVLGLIATIVALVHI